MPSKSVLQRLQSHVHAAFRELDALREILTKLTPAAAYGLAPDKESAYRDEVGIQADRASATVDDLVALIRTTGRDGYASEILAIADQLRTACWKARQDPRSLADATAAGLALDLVPRLYTRVADSVACFDSQTSEEPSPPPKDDLKVSAVRKLKPCETKARHQYDATLAQFPDLEGKSPDEVYQRLKQWLKQRGEEDELQKLPCRDTWKRHLRSSNPEAEAEEPPRPSSRSAAPRSAL